MPSDSHEQQLPPSVSDKKSNGESQSFNSDEIKAGTKVPMNHAQRQAFFKTSHLGQVFGVAHLLPEVAQLTDAAPEESPSLNGLQVLVVDDNTAQG